MKFDNSTLKIGDIVTVRIYNCFEYSLSSKPSITTTQDEIVKITSSSIYLKNQNKAIPYRKTKPLELQTRNYGQLTIINIFKDIDECNQYFIELNKEINTKHITEIKELLSDINSSMYSKTNDQLSDLKQTLKKIKL